MTDRIMKVMTLMGMSRNATGTVRMVLVIGSSEFSIVRCCRGEATGMTNRLW